MAVAIARMTHLAVMVMSDTLPFGEIPDTPFTHAIQYAIRMDGMQMHALRLASFHPGAMTAFGASPFDKPCHSHTSTPPLARGRALERLDTQALYTVKVTAVVGQEREIVTERCGTNKEITIADHEASGT